jgi:hypothetical protein
MTHAQAAALATSAFLNVFGRTPSIPELRLLLAKGLAESSYGAGWKRPEGYSGRWPPNNIGAVQATSAWTGETFAYGDTHAGGQGYVTRFKAYPTAAEGWQDFVRELYQNPSRGRSAVLAAASADDPWAFSYQVVATGYSESRAKSPQRAGESRAAYLARTLDERSYAHYTWLAPMIRTIDAALGFPAPAHDSWRGPGPTPFPPAAPAAAGAPSPTGAPDPSEDDGMIAALQAHARVLADNTVALGTLHQDIAALRSDLLSFRQQLLAHMPEVA